MTHAKRSQRAITLREPLKLRPEAGWLTFRGDEGDESAVCIARSIACRIQSIVITNEASISRRDSEDAVTDGKHVATLNAAEYTG